MAQTRFPLSLIFFVAHVVEWGTFAARCEAVAPEGTGRWSSVQTLASRVIEKTPKERKTFKSTIGRKTRNANEIRGKRCRERESRSVLIRSVLIEGEKAGTSPGRRGLAVPSIQGQASYCRVYAVIPLYSILPTSVFISNAITMVLSQLLALLLFRCYYYTR